MGSKIKSFFALLLPLYFMTACNSKAPNLISEDDMAKIIREAFISDAYSAHSMNRSLYDSMPADSIDIYAPIFKKYGYKKEDFIYSVDKYTARKSQKMNAIFAKVEASIESEYNNNNYYFAMARRLDSIVVKDFTAVIFKPKDSVIRITTEKGIKDNTFRIPLIGKGSYTIKFKYTIKGGDSKHIYRSESYILAGGDSVILRNRRTSTLRRSDEQSTYAYKVQNSVYSEGTLVVRPVYCTPKAGSYDIRIRDLEVSYTPMLYMSKALQIEKLTNIKLRTHEKDSSILPIFERKVYPPRLPDTE